jgi:hypothetical protein
MVGFDKIKNNLKIAAIFLKKILKKKLVCEGKGSILGTILECSTCWNNHSGIEAFKE